MGTRHLTIIKHKDVLFGQYGQFDGYPDSAGLNVLEFLKKKFKRDKFIKNFSTAKMLSDAEISAFWEEAGAKGRQFVGMDVASKFDNLCPLLNREIGTDILEIIQKIKEPALRNQIDFAADSLMCEWGWMVDLDRNEFVAFRGFNTKPLPKREFFSFMKPLEKEFCPTQYYPIRSVARWKLNKLPTNKKFLAAFKSEGE